jgi:hypothetical protein
VAHLSSGVAAKCAVFLSRAAGEAEHRRTRASYGWVMADYDDGEDGTLDPDEAPLDAEAWDEGADDETDEDWEAEAEDD